MEGFKIERLPAYVLDTSVVVKWFSLEEHYERALKLRERFMNGEILLVVPDLLLHELSNALMNDPKFDERTVCNAVLTVLNLGLDINYPTEDVLLEAVRLSYQFKITAYDACFLALANYFDAKLVTADEKFYERVKDTGLVVLLSGYL